MLSAKGFRSINRLHLALGILSYLASPLWFIFMILGTIQCQLYWAAGAPPRFDSDIGLSSFLDIGGGRLALILFIVTIVMLTLPKVLAVLLTMFNRRRCVAFGGRIRVLIGFLLEHFFSVLMAPIQMCFNTRFVTEIMMGRDVPWNPQSRDAGNSVDWGGIFRAHAGQTAIGVIWAMIALRINPAFFWWLSPVTFGLMGSIPISALLSMPAVGSRLRRMKLFLIPAESHPPSVVTHLEKNIDAIRRHLTPQEWIAPHYGLMQVLLDPYLNAAHGSLIRQRRTPRPLNRYLRDLTDRLLAKGPGDLTRREQMALLLNAQAVAELHDRIWQLPEAHLSPWWKLAMRHYNSLTDRPQTALYR